ncbi:MAG: prepilin-type N-terminal cleavage/methylation domain-containing protein [Terriglobales bacterium]|jgi:prepilin-type N-terminal cleavage/methylation domain-containing protein|nr:prepilin-type N-terminal cleavage/methylation domain-containing protein [Terriglobales bacterium]
MQHTRITKFSHRRTLRESRGFSLLELLIVLSLFMVVAGMTFITLQPGLKDARANQAFDQVMIQMRVARQRAIAERKQYIVCFGSGSAPTGALTPMGTPTATSVQLFRWDAGTALSAAAQISASVLPDDIQFQAVSGVPVNPTSVPDGFGSGITAIDFDQGVGGGVKNQIMFMPDGSAHDTAGSWNSGIIYVGRTGDLYSSRAVTLYGATGRIRGWRLINSGGSAKWMEQ